VSFCESNLAGAVFTGADLGEADMRWARYRLDDLRDADLTSARLRD
jgi:uncharacterized protein YjbI with pentapeptide repeats